MFIYTKGICPECKQEKVRLPSCGWWCQDCVDKLQRSEGYQEYRRKKQEEEA